MSVKRTTYNQESGTVRVKVRREHILKPNRTDRFSSSLISELAILFRPGEMLVYRAIYSTYIKYSAGSLWRAVCAKRAEL